MTTSPPLPASSETSATPKPRISGLAIAGLVLGILGLCTFGLTAIPGLILAIVAFMKIKRSEGNLAGRGLSIAGIVVSGLAFALIPVVAILAAILMPALARARDAARCAASMHNVRQLCMAVMTYEVENGGRLPVPREWPERLRPYVGDAEKTYADPSDPDGGRGYAMNGRLENVSMGAIRLPSRTVLFFECSAGSPPAGGVELLPSTPRHGDGFVVGFCDGHVERVSPRDLDSLVWDPLAERPNQ